MAQQWKLAVHVRGVQSPAGSNPISNTGLSRAIFTRVEEFTSIGCQDWQITAMKLTISAIEEVSTGGVRADRAAGANAATPTLGDRCPSSQSEKDPDIPVTHPGLGQKATRPRVRITT